MEKINEWLMQPPAPEELMEVSTGVYTQPIEVIVDKLNKLTDKSWSTKNFHHQIIVLPIPDKDGNNVIKVSGSVEVEISYNDRFTSFFGGLDYTRILTRILTGAATFSTTEYQDNEHWAATVKSLAIVNAVQVLGPQFGWGLNSGTLPTEKLNVEKPKSNFKKKILAAVKVAPDAGIKAQWNTAVDRGNTKMIKYLYAMYTITPGENGYHFVKIEE